MSDLPGWKDKALFTPGPLTTSPSVKQAMLRDLGSRDFAFIEAVCDIRARLLAAGGVSSPAFEAIPMQGSGTFSVEAVFSSCVPPDGKVLIVINGAYGQRMKKICQTLKIEHAALEYAEDRLPGLAEIEETLEREAGFITHLAIVHCETTTGIVNPIAEVGAIARRAGIRYIVDAMSSFGGLPIDLAACAADYLVSSSNKCIEGVPGFGFTIARREALLETRGWARSLSLDLLGQWEGLEANGQFRFTPPTHAMLAFRQALLELEAEGGVAARHARYARNHAIVVEGMRALGFKEYLRRELQGPIITSFRFPDDPKWDFEGFYRRLNDRGYVIYPGKVSNADCFRIGHIGRLFESDMRGLIAAIGEVVREMGLKLT